MIRPWFRHAAVPWKTTATQTRASGENRVSTKPGVLHVDEQEDQVVGVSGVEADGGDLVVAAGLADQHGGHLAGVVQVRVAWWRALAVRSR